MSKSILIISAGAAGLVAGCYAQMNGFKTKIFEMHNKPGGLCATWQPQITPSICVYTGLLEAFLK